VSELDRSVVWPDDSGGAERLWIIDDLSAATESPLVDVTGTLVSLRFLKSELGRRKRLWCVLAALGLLVGLGLYVTLPPAYTASTTVLLGENPNVDPNSQVLTDVQLAQSATVGQAVLSQLGLTQPVGSLQADTTVTPVTAQVLIITVSAPTSQGAVSRTAAVAAQFLKFRAHYAQIQEQETDAQLAQQVTQAQQQVDSLASQVTSFSGSSAELDKLKAKQSAAQNQLAQVQQYVTGTESTVRTATTSMVNGSEVLNPATAGKKSRLILVLYAGGGLMGGVLVGACIVIFSAILSDRLRRRSDIAKAMGAPVRLSVGPLRTGRGLSLGRRDATRERDRKYVIEHLGHMVPGSSRGPTGLVVVAVDDAQTVSEAVVGLARETAEQGMRVMIADLSKGACVARQLGTTEPGIQPVTTSGKQVVLVVPESEDPAPIGPLRSRATSAGHTQAGSRLAQASASADLVLTLATLDPAFPPDYLATWGTDAVAVVTAGRSSATVVGAAGDMIRLAGMRLTSVVLLGADKNDDSLGMLAEADRLAPA